MNNQMMMKGPYREIVPLGSPLTVSLALPKDAKPGAVKLLENGTPAKSRRDGDRLIVEVPNIHLHEVIAVDLV